MSEWARVAATTIEKFNKGFEEAIKRRRILLDRADKMGNVKKNVSGLDYTWQVKMAQAQMQINNGTQIVNFAPFNRYIRATLPYVGYIMADSITKREKLQNRGPQAMIDYLSQILKDLYDDVHDRFSEVLYVDVNASGNAGNVQGFGTWIGTVSNVLNVSNTVDITSKTTTTSHAAVAADIVGVPAATYAGISTAPGAVGGTWNGQWPIYGKGDSLYDFYSPLLVNYTSSSFPGAGVTWSDNCVEASRFGLTFLNRNRASEGTVDLELLTTNMFRLFKSKLDPKERVILSPSDQDREYGISRQSIQFEGAEVTHEAGIPSDVGFFANMEKFELLSMQDKLFAGEGPHENPTDRTDRFAVDMLGQLKFASPRFFGALLNIA